MDSLTAGDTTLLPAGFEAAGFTSYPAICDAETGQGAAFQSLIDLINDTSNALTYEQFLTEKLANACNELGDLLQDKVDYLNTHITYFGDMKTDLLTEFLGTFMNVAIGTPPTFFNDLPSFTMFVQSEYEIAKMMMTIPPNPFEVFLPQLSPVCQTTTQPLEIQINLLVASYIDTQNCLIFAEDFLCGQLQSEVFDVCNALYQAELATENQGIADQITAYQGVDPAADEASLMAMWLGEVNDHVDPRPIVPQPDLCPNLPAVPTACTTVSAGPTNTLQ
jgi:hypothetical protein